MSRRTKSFQLEITWLYNEKTLSLSFFLLQLNKSNASKVTIRGVKRTQSGVYQCEVSADAPSFHTENSGSSMTVVELPLTEPFIVVNSPQPELSNNKLIISYGDSIKATCISPVSHPPVNFTWSVNNAKYPVSIITNSCGLCAECVCVCTFQFYKYLLLIIHCVLGGF